MRLFLRALDVVRDRGWEPAQKLEDYDRLSKVGGFYEKTMPLVVVTYDILVRQQPIGVRGLLYRLVSAGWVESTSESCYQRVDRLTITLRERELVPFEWIVDELRVRLKPGEWEALQEIEDYERDLFNRIFTRSKLFRRAR
jgi:hypothetical protein